jgi:hypothetical protein
MNEAAETSDEQTPQADFEKLTASVSAEFQVEEALVEHNVPTYYLKQALSETAEKSRSIEYDSASAKKG